MTYFKHFLSQMTGQCVYSKILREQWNQDVDS